MGKPLRALIVSDSSADPEPLVRRLAAGGFDLEWERAASPADLAALADRGVWDVVIADYAAPQAGAPAALEVLRALGLDLPFIVVSEAAGEDLAVQTMRAGARDYILKGDLARLAPAVEREVSEAAARRAGQRAESERQALQSQLVRSQKMEAVGRLAGGVAHEFNNMMTAVTGHARRLLRRLGPEEPARRELEEILQAGERAAALTRQLLAFSRRQIFRVETLDLNAVAAKLEAMLRRLLGEDIDLVTRLAPGLWPIRADRAQIEQVIVNLAVNAREAMPDGGGLTIGTANVRLEDPAELARLELAPGDYALLAVEDTGGGMDAETRAHLFEPFFTTKQPGEGTGLGLPTVYGIVKQSGAGIVVASEPGRGTAFRIYFPRVREPAGAPAPAAPPAAREGPRGAETVLLVEDEDIVRRLISLELQDAGYRVLQAANTGEALAVAGGHQGPIHLLLTDVILPGMSGPRLFETLAPLRPETRVLYISGHTEKHIVQHGVLKPGTAFLEKPFTPETLAAKIREVLDAP